MGLSRGGRALGLAPLQAFAVGMLCNASRILLFLLLTLGSGETPSELLHLGLGIGLFSLVVGCLLWRHRWAAASELATEADPWLGPTSRLTWVGAVLVGLAVALGLGLQSRAEKRIDHAYSVRPTPDFRRVHVNHFVEYRGGAGWILLEHPVEVCLRARGIDVDAWEGRLRGDRRRLAIDQEYRLAGETFRHRGWAALAKWARPRLWNEPLHARIRLFEPSEEVPAQTTTGADSSAAQAVFASLPLRLR